ncbi:MAG: hypothetical protein COV07_01950 [Candidatus Vogelbacteria bacterium CG10_big_fil_rev_8_21_14_0_10_45_14]|uniref:Uncharacterized protein n=1 Tax=Candidatus Vogelbacteria bacterium CG10_big_fil_rev_8_21_14_0_10_45_14 TaxID=1975042 RepID=A0A2H0RLK7_9BACT|nr:MAG: hypothetical protein COV07_01950 [Candidatus Vogelbacteria bacterium CG10_big_fil_rev_8_21_14_0_10_45_14]
MLRNLLVRGLIEREEDPKDKRGYIYRASINLYAHLGITRKEELPEYDDLSVITEKTLVSEVSDA